MRAKNWLALAVIVLLIVLNWSTIKEFAARGENNLIGKATDVIQIPEEVKTDHDVYFCHEEDCGQHLVEWIGLAESKVHCAFYDASIEEVISALAEKDGEGVEVQVVVDADNYEPWENIGFARADTRTALMHNKFCVIDDQVVWTGSFNPTYRGNGKNDNHAVVYQSKYLAENYEDEFSELWEGVFGKGQGVRYPHVIVDGIKVENYFCPEDWCANKVIYALQKANSSIKFMTFSFTHDGIGDEIIAKWKEGIEVRGVAEKQQNNKWTEMKKFEELGMDVLWDGNRYKLHHKVFIIDDSVVVTGSFNPTKNGDEVNDENLLIIHDPSVAKQFVGEFERVCGKRPEHQPES